MITNRLIRADSLTAQPWKNGGGTTCEIAVDSAQPFAWRLSRAKIENSGPFSAYPGYERSLVLLKGGPVTFHLGDKKPRVLPPLVPVAFAGEAAVRVEVAAGAEDFNLFTLKGAARGRCYPTFFQGGEQMQFPIAGSEHFIHLISGSINVGEPSSGEEFSLSAGDTYWASRSSDAEHLNLRAQASSVSSAIWVVVHRV